MNIESRHVPVPGTILRPLVIVLDAQGRIVHWSESCRELFGRAIGAVRDQTIRDVLKVAEDAAAGVSFPGVFQSEGGGRGPSIAWTAASIANGDGRRNMIVTGVRRTEGGGRLRTVGTSDSRLSSSFPMWVFDRSTLALVAANEAALEAYGYSGDELIGLGMHDICATDDFDGLLSVLIDLREAWIGPWTQRQKDGSTFAAEVGLMATEHAGRPSAIAIVRGIMRSATEDGAGLQRASGDFSGKALGLAHALEALLAEHAGTEEGSHDFRVRLARAHALSMVDLVTELLPKAQTVRPPVAVRSGTHSIASAPAGSRAPDDAEGPLAIEALRTSA